MYLASSLPISRESILSGTVIGSDQRGKPAERQRFDRHADERSIFPSFGIVPDSYFIKSPYCLRDDNKGSKRLDIIFFCLLTNNRSPFDFAAWWSTDRWIDRSKNRVAIANSLRFSAKTLHPMNSFRDFFSSSFFLFSFLFFLFFFSLSLSPSRFHCVSKLWLDLWKMLSLSIEWIRLNDGLLDRFDHCFFFLFFLFFRFATVKNCLAIRREIKMLLQPSVIESPNETNLPNLNDISARWSPLIIGTERLIPIFTTEILSAAEPINCHRLISYYCRWRIDGSASFKRKIQSVD